MISAIVDLDSLGFIVAYQQFVKLENKTDAEKVKNHVKDFVSSILNSVGAEEYMLFYQSQKHKNYRLEIYPEYKANRPETPEFFTHWRSVLYKIYEELGAVALNTIETDDALSIVFKIFPEKEIVLCHNDKDMFQIPCKHYLYKKLKFIDISIADSIRNLNIQLLQGDSIDNIKGCRRIGEVKAAKAIDSGQSVIDVYKSVYGTDWRQHYVLNAKMIILGRVKEDFPIKWIKNTNLFKVDALFECKSLFD